MSRLKGGLQNLSSFKEEKGNKGVCRYRCSFVRPLFASEQFGSSAPVWTDSAEPEDREPKERTSLLPPDRRGSPQLIYPMRSEDESRSGSPHAGGRDSVSRKRGDAWTLRAPGRRPLLRATIRRANNLQASHPPGAPVLQKPSSGDEEIHSPVQR